MRSERLGLVLFLSAALCGPPALAASDAESNAAREAQDRAQIEKLMWTYVRALDTENADAYVATYTPDGQFGTGASAVKGRAALKKMIQDLHTRGEAQTKKGAKRAAMYHVLTNEYVEFLDKDHARMQSYWMTVFAGETQGAAARVAAVGREVDELVRLNGQWLIKVRDVTPKD